MNFVLVSYFSLITNMFQFWSIRKWANFDWFDAIQTLPCLKCCLLSFSIRSPSWSTSQRIRDKHNVNGSPPELESAWTASQKWGDRPLWNHVPPGTELCRWLDDKHNRHVDCHWGTNFRHRVPLPDTSIYQSRLWTMEQSFGDIHSGSRSVCCGWC